MFLHCEHRIHTVVAWLRLACLNTRLAGETSELVVYPGEYHGIATPSYIKDLYERYLAWYDEYVRGATAPVS